ncbi:MAG: AAA family ATPase [Phocaeicola sp.]
MIAKLQLKNFKSHKDTDIQLKGLTVLTGVNGCGKSSLIQSLLLLRQTFQKGRLMAGLDLNKPLCDIGIGNDALYRLASEGEILFRVSLDNEEHFQFVFDADERVLNDSFLSKKKYSNNVNPDKLTELPLFNNNFQYVSASRWGGKSIFPKETYAAESQRQISLECGQGELVAQFLVKFGGEDTFDYTNGGEEDLSLLNQTIYWERKISPNVTIRVESGKDNNSYAISYGYKGGENIRSIQDLRAENVGYGISYTLPVVVALLSARPGALIIIENPEAHLHPKGQSELAKLITMVVSKGVQVLIETHSDHIISGIQLACKDYGLNKTKGLSPEDISIYNFYNKEDHSLQMDEVKILDSGRLEHQPKGFFDQAESDMFKLFEA